jgi:tRNA G18 (ribose-2'-O)-methylase SpoU
VRSAARPILAEFTDMTSSQNRKSYRSQALRRYAKHRRRNLLAQPGEQAFIIVLDHLKAGFNVPKIFRSAQAFGAREVHLIDIGPFDPAPAKGAFKAVPARFFDDFDASYRLLRERGYRLFTLEPCSGVPLCECALPEKSAFVLGHEEQGLSFVRTDYPDICSLTIPQSGRVESLNVSVAASIVMYEYVRRRRKGSG